MNPCYIKTKKDESKIKDKDSGLVYELNKETKVAAIIGNFINNNNILIPKFIKYQMEEFIITSIQFYQNEYIQFSPDSQIKTICAKSFYGSPLKSIIIPQHTTQIGKCAFFKCEQLQSVEFSSNSELLIIEKGSFAYSAIECITIPPHVRIIRNETFNGCDHLQKVEFYQNSELDKIEKDAFLDSSIKSLTIPSSVRHLEKGWCEGTPELTDVRIISCEERNIKCHDKLIIGKSDTKSDKFDILHFVPRDLKEVTIPSFIKIIDAYSFSQSKIKNIIIPQSVRQICEGAFSLCPSLRSVEIVSGSNLETIEDGAFFDSGIESIVIPSSLKELKEEWCRNTENLKNVEISVVNNEQNIVFYENKFIIGKSDIKSNEYDVLHFVPRDVERVTIPSFIKQIASYAFSKSGIIGIVIPQNVTRICSYAFYYCSNLRFVDLSSNSKLRIIEECTFAFTSIEKIIIQPQITHIGNFAFNNCTKLKRVEIPNNSQLQVIGAEAFMFSSIKSIFIPQNVTEICDLALNVNNSMIVEIAENSQLFEIKKRVFNVTKEQIIMIPAKMRNQIKI